MTEAVFPEVALKQVDIIAAKLVDGYAYDKRGASANRLR